MILALLALLSLVALSWECSNEELLPWGQPRAFLREEAMPGPVEAHRQCKYPKTWATGVSRHRYRSAGRAL